MPALPAQTSPADFHERFGPSAVIAGGSDGIGAAFATELARRGLDLVLIARNQEKLDATARRIRGECDVRVETASIDLTAADVSQQVSAATCDLDVGLFIYNAGAGRGSGPFLDGDIEHWMHQLALGCSGPLRLSHAFGNRLRERGRGGLVLMSSISSLIGSAYIAAYAASKAFDTILGEALFQELAPLGIDVVTCLAGATDTETFREDTPGRAIETMAPEDVAIETLDFLGRGPIFVPGEANRAAVKGMWPVPRLPLINAISKINGKNFDLPYHPSSGDEFSDA